MTTALGMPHFINYPGSLPGQIPGILPPATVSLSTQFNGSYTSSNANGNNTYGTVPLSTVQVPLVPVGGGCYNDGMEVVWHGEFSRLFSNFFPPHVWYLTITNQAPQQKWKFHRDSAKVRFCCQDCGNGWTSMKGRVTFWFYLDYERNAGFVQFKLYGQQCKKCNSGKFEYVMWYPEEVSKVMCNVYHKVGQTYYGFMQPPIRIDRRPGRPRNQHNAELCQACRDGECDQARPIKPLFNLNNSLVPPPLHSAPLPPVNSTALSSTSPSLVQSTANATKPTESLTEEGNIAAQTSAAQITSASEVNSKSVINTQPQGIGYMTTPVTFAAGLQPLITYSVVSGQTKPTIGSNQLLAQNSTLPAVNGHYIYHPSSHHIMSGAIPIHPSAIYPVVPQKQIIQSDYKTSVQATTIASLTNELEASKISEDLIGEVHIKLEQQLSTEDAIETIEASKKIDQVRTERLQNNVNIES